MKFQRKSRRACSSHCILDLKTKRETETLKKIHYQVPGWTEYGNILQTDAKTIPPNYHPRSDHNNDRSLYIAMHLW